MGARRIQTTFALLFGVICLAPHSAHSHSHGYSSSHNGIVNTDRSECTKPFFAVDSECFLLFKDDFTWSEAKTACEVAGGKLAEPKNPVILSLFLREQTPAEQRDWNQIHWWIGGKLIRNQPPWKWNSGRPIESSYWHGEQKAPVFPASNEDTCLTLSLLYAPLEICACHAKRPSICQF